MTMYKVDIHYNRPMHTSVHIKVKEGEELNNDTIHNFLSNYIECLNMEEDYHTDHEFYIEKTNEIVDKKSIWEMINIKTGECK